MKDCWQRGCWLRRSVRICYAQYIFDRQGEGTFGLYMYQHGAELVAEGCMNKTIVEEIIRGRRR